MSLPTKKTPNDFPFKHSGQADAFGDSKGGNVAVIQSDFDNRAIFNQDQINAIITALESVLLNDSGSNTIGHNSASITAQNVGAALEETYQAAILAQGGDILDNSLTVAKMANEMKKGIAGGTAEYDVVDGMSTNVTANTQALNVSSLFNGMEKDDLDRLTLWRNPQTSHMKDSTFTETINSGQNDVYSINLPNNYGDFYRAFYVMVRNGSDASRMVQYMIDTKSNDIVKLGVDYSKMLKTSTIVGNLINSTNDLGCGVYVNESGAIYTADVEYNKDGNGGQGTIEISLNHLFSGTYPRNVNMVVNVFGLV